VAKIRNGQNGHRNIKKLIVTSGDPAGIGPEISLKAGHAFLRRTSDAAIFILSSAAYLRRFFPKEELDIVKKADIPDITKPGIYIVDFDNVDMAKFEFGRATAANGRALGEYIEFAVKELLAKHADAMITAPINKEALNLAGYKFPGHTEMLAKLTGVDEPVMLMYGKKISVALVTIHTALKNVPQMISKELIIRVGKKVNDFYMRFVKPPRIAVAALNPHASENGLFGHEEQTVIRPAVDKLKDLGLDITGPLPADTLFYQAYTGQFDVVIAQYHDQGLVPFKLVAFDNGVNVTVGLPIIRTSPDHGTAYDIAGKNIAKEESMLSAIEAAYTFALRDN